MVMDRTAASSHTETQSFPKMPLEHCLHTGPVQSSAQRTDTHMHECVHSYKQTRTLAMLSNLWDGEVLVIFSEYWIPLAVVYGRYSSYHLRGLE